MEAVRLVVEPVIVSVAAVVAGATVVEGPVVPSGPRMLPSVGAAAVVVAGAVAVDVPPVDVEAGVVNRPPVVPVLAVGAVVEGVEVAGNKLLVVVVPEAGADVAAVVVPNPPKRGGLVVAGAVVDWLGVELKSAAAGVEEVGCEDGVDVLWNMFDVEPGNGFWNKPPVEPPVVGNKLPDWLVG